VLIGTTPIQPVQFQPRHGAQRAFASLARAVLRGLGVPDDAANVNPNGGAIELGRPPVVF
jgi:hypothetical protein